MKLSLSTITPLALLCLATTLPAQQKKLWLDYGGGPDNSHFSPLTQINKANVNQLDVAWTYPPGTTGFSPIVAGNHIYVLGRGSSLIALDATTGKEIWVHENLQGITARGVNYGESKDHKLQNQPARRLIFEINNTIQEIDADTGKSILAFGTDGVVDLKQGLGRDPKTINRIQSNNPGKIRAYDEGDGKVVWEKAIGGSSRGIPAIYEANGREYLVISATPAPPTGAADAGQAAAPIAAPVALIADLPSGWIAFALPEKRR